MCSSQITLGRTCFDCRSKLTYVRLQNYWNKVCEDERRSRLRNEQLLREFDHLERKARELGERTAELAAVNVCVDLFVFHFDLNALYTRCYV